MRLRPPSIPILILAIAALGALLWAAIPTRTPSTNLAADLPSGALMTLESPDFAALLASWNRSPEQRAWLHSAQYSAFANSRLFSRLADAQTGFANAASTNPDGAFLRQVAGRESIFAWYNIGNLEFLYITHLPHDQIAAIDLLRQRSTFARRESAGTAFYLRTATGSPEQAPEETLAQPRTVAFALRGDWLLLATRADLLANALQLMAAQDAGAPSPESQAQTRWFSAASAAGPPQHGDLHMILNLQELTKTPQFRTYWIQRNVTATRQYRSAVVDLYREPTQFREERTLLPMQPAANPTQADLGPLEALVPDHAGVYRALAQPTPDLILDTLENKLLLRSLDPAKTTPQAPAPEPDLPSAGDAAHDLDIRIDTPIPSPENPTSALDPLRRLLNAAQVQSLLTLDRSQPATLDDPFIRLHAAVVLRAAQPWNRNTLAEAIAAALRPQLTTASLGLAWQPAPSDPNLLQLSGAQPLALFTDGPLAILSNDPNLLHEILARRAQPAPPQPALLLAAVRPGQERPNFHRLTTQLADRSQPAGSPPTTSVQLFRDQLPSLADTFAALASEHLTERLDGSLIRQTVLYQWTPAPASP